MFTRSSSRSGDRQRLRRLAIAAAAAAVVHGAAPARADAQTTSQVGHVERSLRVELTGGSELPDRDSGPGFAEETTVRSAAIALRWDLGGSGGIRVAVQGYQRRFASSYVVDTSRTDHTETKDVLVAGTLSSDFLIRVWRDLTVAPSVGIGIVPYMSSSESSSPPNRFSRGHLNSVSGILTSGFALRYRHLVLEKQFSALFGQSDDFGYESFYHPLMIGVRF